MFRRSHADRGALGNLGYTLALLVVAGSLAIGMWWMSPREDFEALHRGALAKDWSYLLDQRRDANQASRPFAVLHHFVPLERVASDLKLAILVGEDTGFFSHGPIDPEAMWEALVQWAHNRRRLRGASTISQQLAKNLFLSQSRTWWRKIDELRLAYWLEHELTKRRIFELYINVIELGPGVYGVDAASEYYFGHPAQLLSASEAASLAAAIPNPCRSNPKTQTRAWQRRRQAIVERMQHLDILRRWMD